ncbi:hypothetical protein GJAV_G00254210 [Gymnothorax javanicus]|nr:hypothetical protein GJAV_G00254210 [Gymnothorax javanicus]
MNMRTRSGGSTPTKVIDPKYANSTSRSWVFGAFAELIDNACDPIINAENQWIDWTQIKDRDCLTFTDDGAGLTYDAMLEMMSDKKTVQWFNSGSMRLGKDAIVFSKTRNTRIVGLLSQTYETTIWDYRYVVPIAIFTEDGDEYILSQEELQRQLQAISTTSSGGSTGTRIIIWNLHSSRGRLEFDFETDPHDIRLPEGPGLDFEPKSIYSLRAYCSILYLEPRIHITIRGEEVHPQLVSHVLENTHKDQYGPNSLEEPITITFGYDPEKKRPGMLLYHKKRLIVANKHVGLRLRVKTKHDLGLVGIAECDFLEPTDNKQDFKVSESYTRFRNSFTEKMLKYRNKAKYSRWKKDPRCTNAVENGETRTTDEDSEDSEDEQPYTNTHNVVHARTSLSDSIAAMNYDSEADVNEVATPLRAPEGDQQLGDASVPEERMETNTRAAVTDQTEGRERAVEENITSSGEDQPESLEETQRQLRQEPHDQVPEGEDSLTRQIFKDLNCFKDDVNQRIDHKFEELLRRLEDLRGAESSTVSPRPAQSAGAGPSQPGSPEAERQKKQQQERNGRQTAEDGASTSSVPATPSAQGGARPCDSGSESPQEGTSSAFSGSHGLEHREPVAHATPRGKRFSLSIPWSEQAKRAKSEGESSSSSSTGTEAVSESRPSMQQGAPLHWTMDDFQAVVVFTEEATPFRKEGDISQQLDNGAIPAEPMETNTTASDLTSAVQQSVSVASQTERVAQLKQEVEEENTRSPVEHQPKSLEQTQGQQITSKTVNCKGDQYKEHQVEQEPSDQGEDDLTMQWDSIFTDLSCFKDEMDQLRIKCEEQSRELEDLMGAGSSTVSPRPAQSAGASPSQPGSLDAERLGSLRVTVSRLLLMLIPDLDLDQVNYESTVIEEMLDQYLEGVSRSGAE